MTNRFALILSAVLMAALFLPLALAGVQEPGAGELSSVPAFLTTLPALIVISLLGMFVHFLKKNIKGETTTEIKSYFSDHFKSTFIAATVTVISTIGLYAGFSTGQPIDIITVFLLGLGFDSTLNSWEKRAGGGGT